MFDIGFWELLFISVIGLLVLGPEKLPRVARSVGLWAGRARGMVRKLQREIDREITIAELRERQIKPQEPAVSADAGPAADETEHNATPKPGDTNV